MTNCTTAGDCATEKKEKETTRSFINSSTILTGVECRQRTPGQKESVESKKSSDFRRR
ncbi:hypothetical protein LIPSTDRAFT_76422 [Lipomyces starkeyi NRRL Y-11557]|uniref:Uncharacterized protein n=1 Tax=Lipomyces starkeyi NRRL Y-11557 TaxID=675824 RepID=A0A1E3PUU6_LIPST|nr:hypothetical protein LIPSTDRAFT_76422 [Lipomyces starkeyi NRRL Y-11557]